MEIQPTRRSPAPGPGELAFRWDHYFGASHDLGPPEDLGGLWDESPGRRARVVSSPTWPPRPLWEHAVYPEIAWSSPARDSRRLSAELLAKIESALERLVAVLQAAEEATATKASIGALHALGDGSLLLATPVLYAKEEAEDGVSVGIDEFGVYAWGETDYEAVDALGVQLTHLYHDLAEAPDDSLGPMLLRTKRFLLAAVRSDGENIQRG